MNYIFSFFKNTVTFLFLIFTFVSISLAQVPQYYNYNTGTSLNIFPFGQPAGKEVQWLVLANDFNQPAPLSAGNTITKLYFYMGSAATVTFTDLTIKLGQTSLTSLPAGVIYTGRLDTVYFRSSVSLTSAGNAWMSITLDRLFPVDISQSLVIDVSQCGASGSGMWVRQTTLTPVRRNYINHSGNCVFVYVGQDGSMINCGIDVVPTTICEGFNSPVFPPIGWSVIFTGINYWSRYNVSGFGLGVGSARYDMWIAPPGTNQDLVTPVFAHPTQFSTLSFDFAYAPWPESQPYYQDSLIVQSSTNAGTSWTILANMGPIQLQTAPSGNNEFFPIPGQWGRITYTLPAGTNKIDLKAKSQFGNNLFLDSICVDFLVGIKNHQTGIPKVYSLSQNYPNPFNPSTLIQYSIAKSGFVKLYVYDVLGSQVASLVNENKQAGSYSIRFEGENFTSGVYFYKIVSGDYTAVKKMVLLK
jgi:hypothetical protein